MWVKRLSRELHIIYRRCRITTSNGYIFSISTDQGRLSNYCSKGKTKSRYNKSRYKFREPIQFDEVYEDPILHTNIMATSDIKPQNFDYFLVLDFEATCEKDVQIHPQVMF